MTPGFESWWRVGVAEVSTSETVAAAYEDMQLNIKKQPNQTMAEDLNIHFSKEDT